MKLFSGKRNKRFLTTLLVMLLLTVMVLPAMPGQLWHNGAIALAVDNFDSQLTAAVRHSYGLHRGGLAVDGGYGHFGAYEAYILTKAGAVTENWLYNEAGLKGGILDLIAETTANEGTDGQSNSKRLAQEYLAAKEWAEPGAAQLLNSLINRQTASANGSFDTGLYGIYSSMPAFEALRRAGDLDEFDTAGVITYILANQDPATKAWPAEDAANWITNDFMTTTQAIRALAFLKPYAGDQTAAVQAAIDAGLEWLQGRQQADGSFRDAAGFDDPLVDAAEVIVTLHCLGMDPASWTSGGKSAVDYMRDTAQNADGSFGGSKNLSDDIWAIDAYGVLGGSVAAGTALAVEVTPAAAEIAVGQTKQYAAQALRMDGALENVSATAAWTVDNVSIATVDANGLATGAAAGSAVITATYQGAVGIANLTVAGGGGGGPAPQGTPVSVCVIGKSGETLFNQTTVYLQSGDTHGITPAGALHKTGLSYSYDSPDYVHTIAGQGPQGMNGWMYKVNGTILGVAANSYTLNANDQVLWFYSTNADNVTGLEGVLPPAQQAVRTGDELISAALEKDGEVTISLEKREENAVSISPDTVRTLAEKNKELTLSNQGVTIIFAPGSLLTDQTASSLEQASGSLQIGAKEVGPAEKQEILEQAKIGQSSGLFEIGGKIVDLTAQIIREGNDGSQTAEKVAGFAEPVKVSLSLADVNIEEADIAKLTAVRYEKDTTGQLIAVKLGGSYDPATKTFTFYTERFSWYGVAKAEELVTVDLRINMLTTYVNGKKGYTDTAPMLINNRTMVPLRFVAESLGASVNWHDETGTVEIALKTKNLKLVIDKTSEGMDTPAMIMNKRTLVPLRYVAEYLGARVTWHPAAQRVEIVK